VTAGARSPRSTAWRAFTLAVGLPGLGLALAACGSTFAGTTLAQQVTSWAASTGFSASLRTLQGDIKNITTASARQSPASMHTYCDVLVTDTLSANQNLPSPDQRLTTLLSAAYSAAGTAGRDCFSGAGKNAGLLARSATESATAHRDLIKAQARYDLVTSGLSGLSP
jgi:hypothetical protein